MNLILKKFDKSQMYLLKKDPGISRQLRRNWKKREPAFMYVMMTELKKGDVFFDIGANLGYNTVRASEILGRKARMIAVEPDPVNCAVLRKNVKLNGFVNTKVAPYAVSDKSGIQAFYRARKSNLGSMHKTKGANKPIEVRTYTVGDLCKAFRVVPTFYKMDVEGGEVAAIRGMLPFLEANPGPVKILIEVHQTIFAAEGLDFETPLKQLFALGFKPKYTVSAGKPQPKLFKKNGYKPYKIFGGRGLYKNLKEKHILSWACHPRKDVTAGGKPNRRIIRSIMLDRTK